MNSSSSFLSLVSDFSGLFKPHAEQNPGCSLTSENDLPRHTIKHLWQASMHALNPDLAQHKVLSGCLIQQRAFCACSAKAECQLSSIWLLLEPQFPDGWMRSPRTGWTQGQYYFKSGFLYPSFLEMFYFHLCFYSWLASSKPQKFPLHLPPPVLYPKELRLPTWSVCVAFTKDVSGLSQLWSRAPLWYFLEIRIIL